MEPLASARVQFFASDPTPWPDHCRVLSADFLIERSQRRTWVPAVGRWRPRVVPWTPSLHTLCAASPLRFAFPPSVLPLLERPWLDEVAAASRRAHPAGTMV